MTPVQPRDGRPVWLSIVIPAFNEQDGLDLTLSSLFRSIERVHELEAEVIVVNDGSTDRTRLVAEEAGAICVDNPGHGVSAARNYGASISRGEYLLFMDADVTVSEWCLAVLHQAILEQQIPCGAPRAIYRPSKLSSWLLCAYWDWKRSRGGPAQGVAQFYQRQLFERLNGYKVGMFMSEDFELYLRALSLTKALQIPQPTIIEDAIVWPSTRRYDEWSALKMLWYQNPVISSMCRSSPRFWRAWRETTVR